MPLYDINAKLKGVFTSHSLLLGGNPVPLQPVGGDTREADIQRTFDDNIEMRFVGRGLSTQEWTITLVFQKHNPDGSLDPKRKFELSGAIPPGGSSTRVRQIKVSELKEA